MAFLTVVCMALLFETTIAVEEGRCPSDDTVCFGLSSELLVEDASAAGNVALELLQRRKQQQQDEKFPGFGDIIDAGRDAIGNAAGRFAPDMDDITGTILDSAAGMAASTLNSTILALGVQADALTALCQTKRKALLEKLTKTKAGGAERLAMLENQAEGDLGSILPLWGNISSGVSLASSVATTALASIGDGELGNKLSIDVRHTLYEADALSESLKNVSGLLANISSAEADEQSKRMALLRDTLKSGFGKADAFAERFDESFDGLLDKIAVKTSSVAREGSGASAVTEAFERVKTTVQLVSGKLVEGPRIIISGLLDATQLAEVTTTPPPTPPPTPPLGDRAAASRGASFALALFGTLLVMPL